ncbi:hypothetical protein [Nonomuraea sp. MG754425]|uniref:hypothetical protein n=1 Tax=Nonomuraea sp. MG754425 TaxID=2570319 RepID=UPI001F16317E|nr:hypothetical protein [Nonomuraea sp. MG754425]
MALVIAVIAVIPGIPGVRGVRAADARLARQLKWLLVLDEGVVTRDRSLRHALPWGLGS